MFPPLLPSDATDKSTSLVSGQVAVRFVKASKKDLWKPLHVGRATDRDGHASIPRCHPHAGVSVPASSERPISTFKKSLCTNQVRRELNVFVELMLLLKERTLLITVARLEEKLKVNVIPAKVREGEDDALSTPLSYTGSPEELDAELASYVDSHLTLGSTLAEAKAEMEAAAKAARQKSRTVQPAPKADAGPIKKEETAVPIPTATDATPSLFPAQPQPSEPAAQAPATEGSDATR